MTKKITLVIVRKSGDWYCADITDYLANGKQMFDIDEIYSISETRKKIKITTDINIDLMQRAACLLRSVITQDIQAISNLLPTINPTSVYIRVVTTWQSQILPILYLAIASDLQIIDLFIRNGHIGWDPNHEYTYDPLIDWSDEEDNEIQIGRVQNATWGAKFFRKLLFDIKINDYPFARPCNFFDIVEIPDQQELREKTKIAINHLLDNHVADMSADIFSTNMIRLAARSLDKTITQKFVYIGIDKGLQIDVANNISSEARRYKPDLNLLTIVCVDNTVNIAAATDAIESPRSTFGINAACAIADAIGLDSKYTHMFDMRTRLITEFYVSDVLFEHATKNADKCFRGLYENMHHLMVHGRNWKLIARLFDKGFLPPIDNKISQILQNLENCNGCWSDACKVPREPYYSECKHMAMKLCKYFYLRDVADNMSSSDFDSTIKSIPLQSLKDTIIALVDQHKSSASKLHVIPTDCIAIVIKNAIMIEAHSCEPLAIDKFYKYQYRQYKDQYRQFIMDKYP